MASRSTSLGNGLLSVPNLGDLTFEVDPPREWTPPHADSLEHKLWDSPRTSAAYLNANPYRPGNHAKQVVRSSVELRPPDTNKAHPHPHPQPAQPQLQSQPQPEAQPSQPHTQPSAQTSVGIDHGRGTTPRRVSPARVVLAEPSLSQLPSGGPGELPSVRGQTAILMPLSPSASHHHVSLAGTSRRGPLAAQGTAVMPVETGSGTAAAPATGAAQGLAAGVGTGGIPAAGIGVLEHMSTAMASSHHQQSPTDPVETYLARYQLHQRISDTFRVRSDEHVRTVQELGAKIQAMTRVPSPPKRAASKGGERGKSAGAASSSSPSAAAADEAGPGGQAGKRSKTGKADKGPDKKADTKAGDSTAAGSAAAAEPPVADDAAATAATAGAHSSPSDPAAAGAAPAAVGTEAAATAATAGSAAPAGEAMSGAGGAAAAEAEGHKRATDAADGAAGPPTEAASGAQASEASGSPSKTVRLTTPSSAAPPPLPEPPLGRNRFAPLSLPAAITGRQRLSSVSTTGEATAGGAGQPPSPSSPSSALPPAPSPRGATLAMRPENVSGVQQLQELRLQQQLLANQGAYLALPDGSFAGTPPFRAVPTQEGLLFEKYARKGKAAGDLPALQLRYLRPPTTASREPRQMKKIPRQPPPPARALPNGIPASRLERLSARRRSRSPLRIYLQQQQQQQQTGQFLSSGGAASSPHGTAELVQLSGAAVQPAGLGLAAHGDGLLRSPSLSRGGGGARGLGGLGGPPRASSAPQSAAAAGSTGSGTLAQYLAVSTAPTSGEPLLDDNFFDVLQQHFRSSLHNQTAQLRAHLNVNLPAVLGALNCVNVTEPLPVPPPPGSSAYAMSRASSAGAAAVAAAAAAGRMGR